MSREQLSAAVKVSVRQLEALETGRFEHLPAPVFARGFVRSIALHLKLDAETLGSEFRRVHDAWLAVETARKAALETTFSGTLARPPRVPTTSGSHPRLSEPRRAVSADTTVRGLAVAAVLAVLTGGAALLKTRGSEPARAPSPAAAQVERAVEGPASLALPPEIAAATVALPPEPIAPAAAAVAAGAAPSGAQGDEAPMASVSTVAEVASVASAALTTGALDGIKLTLRFQADCWTEVHADGKLVVAELCRKGTSREFSGSKRFTLTLGNAGGVEVTVDGRALDPLGQAGQVVRNVVISG